MNMRFPITVLTVTLAVCAPAHADVEDLCTWTSSPIDPASKDVIATPVVADVDADGVPDVVFVTFRSYSDDINLGVDGILRVISGDDCHELYSVADVGIVTCVDGASMSLDERADIGFLNPNAGAALGDIDGDGAPEIVCIAEGAATNQIQRLVAFEHDGTFKWCSEPSLTTFDKFGASIAFADLDQDGSTEIIAGNKVFDAAGTLLWDAGPTSTACSTCQKATAIADLDATAGLEVVIGVEAYHSDGTLYWERPDLPGIRFPAVADFDLDGVPEVVTVRAGQVYLLDGQTGATRCVVDLPPLDEGTCPPGTTGGGPPTLADVDGDGVPEIGVAGRSTYCLYGFDGSVGPGCLQLLWSQPTEDCSSGFTGSTMFDLEGDGTYEVLYNDEFTFWIFRATDGAVLEEIPNTSRTLHEYPALADVNADGQAEIILGANVKAPVSTNGIRILHDPDVTWTPTRRIFNQHAYHVTNIEDDTTIPVVEENSWEQHNSYRIQLVGTLPTFTACLSPIQASVGVELTLSISAEDTDTQDVLELTSGALPSGASMSPLLPAIGKPVSSTFEWTPRSNQVGEHVVVFTVTDAAGLTDTCEVVIDVAECYLLLGSGAGSTPIEVGGHTFASQLSGIKAVHPVTMEDIPDIPLSSAAGGAAGATGSRHMVFGAPLLQGQVFHAQVVMWNPEMFPGNPEQWSRGLLVYVDFTGHLVTLPFGNENGIAIDATLKPDGAGGFFLEFPFTIDAM